MEQLLPNPIIIALIKNKFSILAGASLPISPIWQSLRDTHNRFKASPFILGEEASPCIVVVVVLVFCVNYLKFN